MWPTFLAWSSNSNWFLGGSRNNVANESYINRLACSGSHEISSSAWNIVHDRYVDRPIFTSILNLLAINSVPRYIYIYNIRIVASVKISCNCWVLPLCLLQASMRRFMRLKLEILFTSRTIPMTKNKSDAWSGWYYVLWISIWEDLQPFTFSVDTVKLLKWLLCSIIFSFIFLVYNIFRYSSSLTTTCTQ